MTRNLSPALLERIAAVDGCRGRWIVDCRELEGQYSYALRSLGEQWPFESADPLGGPAYRYWHTAIGGAYRWKLGSVEDAAQYCAATGWRCRLLWCSDWLNDDCSWPGGYDADSVMRSNARVFRDQFATELVRADGDADGLSLDVRFITAEMLETLHALESYPLISDDDHSALQMELQDAAWEDPIRSDFRSALGDRLQEFAPEGADDWWGEEHASRLSDEQLWWLWNESTGPDSWCEEQGAFWADAKAAANSLSVPILAEGVELPLLAEDQRWRSEPYPWPGAEPSPLVPPLELVP